MKKYLITALLAIAGMASFAPSAKAYNYSDGDLFLGFYQAGSTHDYLLYIGNYGNYTTNGGVYTGVQITLNTKSPITIGSAANISADLTAAFGTNWANTVQWGVGGVQDFTNANTLFVTDPGATSHATSWSSDTSGNQGSTATQVSGMGSAYASGLPGSITGYGAPAASKGEFQAVGTTNSYYDVNPLSPSDSPGSSFSTFSGGNGINRTGAGSVYLDELVATDASGNAGSTPLGPDGSQLVLGSFSLSSGGTITYAAPIPEPSSYALMGLGSLALVVMARRKSKTCIA